MPDTQSHETKILLTGKNGQIGAELAAVLPRFGVVAAFERHELDLASPEQIRNAIREVRPSLIVNAAAYTAVDKAESEEKLAHLINAQAPGILAEEAKKVGALLVHYSTDYVFEGTKGTPYTETDVPAPVNVYGKTKLAGEEAIRASGASHLIFRTSWVYGTRGRNFLLTMLRLATEREELRVVNDQFGAPTWSRAIAEGTASVLRKVLERAAEQSSRPTSAGDNSRLGVYHMTAGGQTTWHAFAEAILAEAAQVPRGVPWFETATNGRRLVAQRVAAISTAEYPAPARRPAYSVLSNARLLDTFGVELPSWFDQLRAVFAEGRNKA